MEHIPYFLVDTGIENVHIRALATDGRVWRERSYAHHGKLKSHLRCGIGSQPAPRPGKAQHRAGRRGLSP